MKKRVVGEGNFLWHIFSWNIVGVDKYYTGDKARKIFDELDKSGAKYFDLWETNPSLKLLGKEMDSKYIDKFDEIYVVASDWSWTYMKTHEENCRPYFTDRNVYKFQLIFLILFNDNSYLSLKSLRIYFHIQIRLPDILSIRSFHVEVVGLLQKIK